MEFNELKRVVREEPGLPDDAYVERLIEEYVKAKELAEKAARRQEAIKLELKAIVAKAGERDHKGNQWLTLGKYTAKNELRTRNVLDVKAAEEWAKSHGYWDQVSTTTLSEDLLLEFSANAADPEITNDVANMFVTSTTSAFKVQEEVTPTGDIT